MKLTRMCLIHGLLYLGDNRTSPGRSCVALLDDAVATVDRLVVVVGDERAAHYHHRGETPHGAHHDHDVQ